MSGDEKLMDMLTGYAAAHRHPFNIWVHMIGIPTIMLGVLIPLTWVNFDVGGVTVNLAHGVMLGFFAFYMTLDRLFAIVFLIFALLIAELARRIGAMPIEESGMVAAVAFVGGYVAQFLGHAVEKSMPVLVRHPIQANLAAPFFTVVELFKILGLRDDLFNEVQMKIDNSLVEKSSS
jgi:uncharacterized membrane protein YGL010W